MLRELHQALRHEIESPTDARTLGSGWISGVGALILGLFGLAAVLCMHFPEWFGVPQIRSYYDHTWVKSGLQLALLLAFSLASLNLVLRRSKVLGLAAIAAVLITSILATNIPAQTPDTDQHLLGLDWLILNLLFTGILFVPLEKVFGRIRHQALFRNEWREDLFYFLFSSLLVQTLSYLSLWPSLTLLQHTESWAGLRASVISQPLWLQFIEIMFLTDLVQYWFHRAFHRIPALWKFHAVHHSAKTMDWLAGSRMHLVEIIGLRSMTIIPMYLLGFHETALYAYIVLVYLYATYIHANVRFDIEWLKPLIVTPRFHHWHHGIEKEAIDVNFAIHFPLFDRLFGTYYMPENQWPSGYGIGGHPVPNGYWKQFLYPFTKG